MNQKNLNRLNKFCALTILLFTQTVFAANFTITPLTASSGTIVSGQTISVQYIVTNMTNSLRSGYTIQGLPATVTQNTSGFHCPTSINLNAHASCHLQFNITGAVSSNFALCKGISCTTASIPLNISVIPAIPAPMPAFLYVANKNGSMASQGPANVCSLNQTTGAISACHPTGGGNVLNYPESIAINSAGTLAYLVGQDNAYPSTVYQCPINADGTFATCSSVLITTPSNFETNYGSITLNASGTMAYISGDIASGASVIACPITNGNISSACSDTGASVITEQTGLSIDKTGTTAYMANTGNATGEVTVCSIGNGGAMFNSCINKTGGGLITFSSSLGNAVLNDNGDIIYIADNAANAVYGCSTSANNASTFDNCFIASTVNSPWGIATNVANTMAYVTEFYGDHTYACPILADGTFPTCSQTAGFDQASGAALKY